MQQTLDDQTVLDEIVDEDIQEGDHDHFTHIINPPNNIHVWREGMSAQDIVDYAKARFLPVKALCGKVWIPKRDTEKFDSCPTCMEIAGIMMREDGE